MGGSISGIVDDITPWNDDSTLGNIATGAALGIAAGVVGAYAGLGLGTTAALGGATQLAYEQDKAAQKRADVIGQQASAARKAAEERRKQLEQERREQLAARRRATIADMAMTGRLSGAAGGEDVENIERTSQRSSYKLFGDTVDI